MSSSSQASEALYLSLGSNAGDRENNIRRALRMLEQKWGVPCDACSSLLETEPWGRWKGEAAPFLNAVARFILRPHPGLNTADGRPALSQEAEALSLLADCKAVERALGREEILEYDDDGERIYHPRPIDIDLLLWGDRRISLPALTIPHPLMDRRDFVLRPLAEIAGKDFFAKIR